MSITNLIKFLLNNILYSNESYARKIGVNIGNDCWIATRKFGSEPFLITIGNHVQITEDVSFYTHGGDWVLRKEIPNFDSFGKIIIKDNVYIGSGACILPGVTVESNVIIAARSVVTKSIPEGVIVGGNPAEIIGYTEDHKLKMLKYNLGTKGLSQREKITKIKDADESLFIKKPYLKDNK